MQPEPRRVSGREGKRNRAVGKVEKQVKGERPGRMEAEEGQGGEEIAKGRRAEGEAMEHRPKHSRFGEGERKGRRTALLRR